MMAKSWMAPFTTSFHSCHSPLSNRKSENLKISFHKVATETTLFDVFLDAHLHQITQECLLHSQKIFLVSLCFFFPFASRGGLLPLVVDEYFFSLVEFPLFKRPRSALNIVDMQTTHYIAFCKLELYLHYNNSYFILFSKIPPLMHAIVVASHKYQCQIGASHFSLVASWALVTGVGMLLRLGYVSLLEIEKKNSFFLMLLPSRILQLLNWQLDMKITPLKPITLILKYCMLPP
ncbi:hypothetical protein L7F22_064385 [Adiantum nelumboides]|nr:hypothetical protein [Adiantum nelumboides]